MKQFLTIVLAACVVFLGCGYGADAKPVRFRTIAKGGFSGIAVAQESIIKDQDAWAMLWKRHKLDRTREGGIPEIDFTREMVAVVTMGRQRTGGYAVEIVRVEAMADRLRIHVRRRTPPPGDMTIQALTAPFHFAALPKSEANVEFVTSR
ncbi:MAG TPA: protease complex subunit PrcB family protein [Clostridia bacterium]|nr:protease complex subunit PrcB family protein [Clostridia bacterium]